MKRKTTLGLVLLAGLAAATPHLQAAAAVAGDAAAPPASSAASDRRFDWVQHTQSTLDELKTKLNLAPAQTAAWETWSDAALKDAQDNLAQMEAMRSREMSAAAPATELSTPEQMQRGIERMRVRLQQMQEHLARLEAAQARTKTFYDSLDKNQKTIFDLFWHDMFDRMGGRMAGQGGPWGMPGWGMHHDEGFDRGQMGPMYDGPVHGQ